MKAIKGLFVCAMVLLVAGSVFAGGKGDKKDGGSAKGPVGSWEFSDPELGTQGWNVASDEFYMYKGTAKLSYDDTTLGKGLLRLDVDFTNSIDLEWSEPKLSNDFPRAYNIKGKTKFVFDFYYNPSLRSDGHFKAKIFSNSNGLKINYNSEEITGGTDAGEGFLKQEVTILIMPEAGFMTDMRLSIAGYLTDYKGPVFFDNIRWE